MAHWWQVLMPRVYAKEVRHTAELFWRATLDSAWSFVADQNRSNTTLFSSQQRRKQAKLACLANEYSIFLLFMTLHKQLTYAFPGNGAKNTCWYFVTSTSDTGSFSLVPVMASEMHGIGTDNASTFHILITGNQTIMNHESFRKRMESPVEHYFEVSFIFW